MCADYLSWLSSISVSANETPVFAAFDPFMPDFQLLQRQHQHLQAIFLFLKTNEWPSSISKQTIRNVAPLAPKIFFDKHKLAWIQLEYHKYP